MVTADARPHPAEPVGGARPAWARIRARIRSHCATSDRLGGPCTYTPGGITLEYRRTEGSLWDLRRSVYEGDPHMLCKFS
jgi:hypothetical protein